MRVLLSLGIAVVTAGILPHTAGASALFTATVGINPNSSCTVSPGGMNVATPVASSGQCTFIGAINGQTQTFGTSFGVADASFGHVGASADAVALNSFGATILNVNASESGTVVFTGPDPNHTGQVLVNGFNIDFGGVLNASGVGTASLGFAADLNGQPYGISGESFAGDGSISCNALGSFTCGASYPAGIYVTDPVIVPLNQPVPFLLFLTTGAGTFGTGDSARADFANSLDLPIGADIFNLPAGYTANAPDLGIFDNQIPSAAAPEPASLYFAGVALLAIALASHAKRRSSDAGKATLARSSTSDPLPRAKCSLPRPSPAR